MQKEEIRQFKSLELTQETGMNVNAQYPKRFGIVADTLTIQTKIKKKR